MLKLMHAVVPKACFFYARIFLVAAMDTFRTFNWKQELNRN